MADEKLTFAAQISAFATRAGAECKALHTKIGSLDSIAFEEKTSIVAALNALNTKAAGIAGDLAAAVARITTNEGDIDTAQADIEALEGRATSLEEDLAALQTQVDELTQIDDSKADSTTTTYSASKIEARIIAEKAALKSDLLNGAGEAYDTLKELADLIVTNKDAIDALEALAVGHVHFDKAQELTDEQKATARSNISAASVASMTAVEGRATTLEGKVAAIEADYLTAADKEELEGKIEEANGGLDAYKAEVGDLTTNFKAVFEAALA